MVDPISGHNLEFNIRTKIASSCSLVPLTNKPKIDWINDNHRHPFQKVIGEWSTGWSLIFPTVFWLINLDIFSNQFQKNQQKTNKQLFPSNKLWSKKQMISKLWKPGKGPKQKKANRLKMIACYVFQELINNLCYIFHKQPFQCSTLVFSWVTVK